MPSDKVMDPSCKAVEGVEGGRTTAGDIESQSLDAGLVEAPDLIIGGLIGQLGDADIAAAELAQGPDEVALVEALERTGHDGSSGNLDSHIGQALQSRAIVSDCERIGQITVVLDQRMARIDDVQVRVEGTLEFAHTVNLLARTCPLVQGVARKPTRAQFDRRATP